VTSGILCAHIRVGLRCPDVWYLIEDFFEQSWIMKLFLLWGWVSVLIMALSFIVAVPALWGSFFPVETATAAAPPH
jgi:hypothetical protein